MNEDSPFTIHGDEPVEARIVSWVLGEASAFEAAELERLCEERPELLVFRRRMRALHGLLTEAEAAEPDESWKLPPEKRKLLAEIFGEEKPVRLEVEKEKRIRRSGSRAFFAIAACVILTLVVLQLTPWKHKSEAIIEVRPRGSGMSPMGDSLSASNERRMTPQFFGTELEKIKSRGNLEKVVENLDLTDRWGVDKEQAIKIVKDSVKTKNVSGTDLIEIDVRHNNKQDADDIAREVATSYKNYRAGIESRDAERQLHELNKAVRDQEDKVEERRKVLSTIARTKGVIYRGDDSFFDRSGVDESREEAVKRGLDAQDYVDAKREFEADQELLQAMKLKQMGETIAGKIPNDSVVIHEAPPEDKGAVQVKSKPAAAGSATPAPTAEPAPMLARRSAGKPLADKDLAEPQAFSRENEPMKPTASVARVITSNAASPDSLPVSGTDVTSPSLDFGDGWAGAADNESKSAAPEGAAIRSRAIALSGLDAAADPFAETSAEPVRLNPELLTAKGMLNNPDRLQELDMEQVESKSEGNADDLRRSLYLAEGNYNLGKYDDARKSYEETLRIDPYNSAARRGLERVEAAKSDYYRAAYDNTRAELLAQVDDAWELEVPAESAEEDAANMDPFWDTSNVAVSEKPAGGVEYEIHTGYKSEYLFRGMALGKDEAKPAPVPLVGLMEENAALDDPYSTFSLNISDASFKVAQAALAKGEQPDPAGIKVEQFYNAVDYGDPAPSAGEPVAVTIEQAANPVIPGRNLVRVALRTAAAGRSAAQPLRLTLLVDQSGSMVREDRRVAMGKALAGLAGLLTKDDQVTVIGFSRTSRLLADGLTGDKAGKLAEIVNQTASEGGTNLEEAINLAGQKSVSRKLAGAQNRIVLFTDGAANLGDADPARLAEKVKQLRRKGISFDIAGIAADGLNDELLGELARNGNGRYYVVGKGNDDDFAKQLAGAFRPAAENVKVQVRFNPERVGKYKLIGFEKDRLKTEDFRNDAVDAAELAAEEAGVAIYQVEPLPGGNGELGEVSVRFRDTASDQMVERTWTIQYDANAPAIDRATPSMQLAVLSMLAGEKLKGGPLADAIDFKQYAESQSAVKHYYGNTGRVAEMLNMVNALK